MKPKKKPVTIHCWESPDRSPQFKIGDRVVVTGKTLAAHYGTVGTVHGIIWKTDPPNFKGYWYEVLFDGYLTSYRVTEQLLQSFI
jgi:hypothetical protein